MDWIQNFVHEYSMRDWSSDMNEPRAKEYAKYATEKMLAETISGLVKGADITEREDYRGTIRELRLMVIKDRKTP